MSETTHRMGDEPLLFSSVMHGETNSGLDSILSWVWREPSMHDCTSAVLAAC